jgi:hypothetical protein
MQSIHKACLLTRPYIMDRTTVQLAAGFFMVMSDSLSSIVSSYLKPICSFMKKHINQYYFKNLDISFEFTTLLPFATYYAMSPKYRITNEFLKIVSNFR